MRRLWIVAIVVMAGWCLALAPAALAQRPMERSREAGDEGPPMNDQQFVRLASAAGLAEVNMGMMGARQATNPEVKQFAQRMVDDHTKMNQQLTGLADRKQMRPASQMDQQHRQLAQRMASMHGQEFDRMFMDQMVKDHEKAVSMFKAEAANGRDPDLRALAEKALPTLEEHLKMAQDLARGGEGGRQGR